MALTRNFLRSDIGRTLQGLGLSGARFLQLPFSLLGDATRTLCVWTETEEEKFPRLMDDFLRRCGESLSTFLTFSEAGLPFSMAHDDDGLVGL